MAKLRPSVFSWNERTRHLPTSAPLLHNHPHVKCPHRPHVRGCLRPFTVGLFDYCRETVPVRMPPFQRHRLQDLPQPWQAQSPPVFRSPPAIRICCCQLPAHDHAPVVRVWSSPLPTAIFPPKDYGLHCPRLYSRRRALVSIAHGCTPAERL